VIIVQSDAFSYTSSVTICPLTSYRSPLEIHPTIIPNYRNGLARTSYAMVDKLSTVKKERIHQMVGRLDQADVAEINRAIILFLALATPR